MYAYTYFNYWTWTGSVSYGFLLQKVFYHFMGIIINYYETIELELLQVRTCSFWLWTNFQDSFLIISGLVMDLNVESTMSVPAGI